MEQNIVFQKFDFYSERFKNKNYYVVINAGYAGMHARSKISVIIYSTGMLTHRGINMENNFK